MLSERLDDYLIDFALPAQLGGGEIQVIFDIGGDPMDLGSEGRSITAIGKTEDLEGVGHGDTIEISGTTYKIVNSNPIDDGKFTRISLGQ